MKTTLYKDINTDTIYTFNELKDLYIENIESDIEVSDDTVLNWIYSQLWSTGGDLQIINNTDSLLLKLNIEADMKETDRYFYQWERDSFIKDLYMSAS